MTIQKAIELAVKGGLNLDDFPPIDLKHLCIEDTAPLFMSRFFWQAVGKSLGWKEGMGIYREPGHFELTEWWSQWHNFIDHLAEGGKAEEWFEKLNQNAK